MYSICVHCSYLFYGIGIRYMLLIIIVWSAASFGLWVGLSAPLHQTEKGEVGFFFSSFVSFCSVYCCPSIFVCYFWFQLTSFMLRLFEQLKFLCCYWCLVSLSRNIFWCNLLERGMLSKGRYSSSMCERCRSTCFTLNRF